MARKLFKRGSRAVRMNLRGCGSGAGLARQVYHSGRSEDLLAVLTGLRAETPDSPTSVLGFSLGGNLALKLAAEHGPAAREFLHRVVAACPPMDLLECSQRIGRPANSVYERHFTRLLLRAVSNLHAQYPELPPASLPRRISIFEFDDLYTAPRCGFRDALDYYARCSSAPLIPQIAVPCRILLAEDDPFVDPTSLDGTRLPENIEMARTRHGGHLGFLGTPGSPRGYRWMDSFLLRWLG